MCKRTFLCNRFSSLWSDEYCGWNIMFWFYVERDRDRQRERERCLRPLHTRTRTHTHTLLAIRWSNFPPMKYQTSMCAYFNILNNSFCKVNEWTLAVIRSSSAYLCFKRSAQTKCYPWKKVLFLLHSWKRGIHVQLYYIESARYHICFDYAEKVIKKLTNDVCEIRRVVRK